MPADRLDLDALEKAVAAVPRDIELVVLGADQRVYCASVFALVNAAPRLIAIARAAEEMLRVYDAGLVEPWEREASLAIRALRAAEEGIRAD